MRPLTVCTVVGAFAAAAALTAGPAAAEPNDAGATTTPTASAAPAPSSAPESAGPESTSTESTGTEPSATAGPEATAAPSTAASAAPAAAGAHQVTYTVTTTSDLTANIYYVSADPPNQGAANDPQYMPMARTLVGPGAPWTFQATLDDPTQWAFVSASGGLRVNPEFRCEIAVDGQVVVSQQGGSGVQCSLRPW